jgi:AcrR family transcriptional regulator
MSSPAKRIDLRKARGEDTREQILDAARDALASAGYARTTTRAIADRAGVPLSLVHYHFGGKQQLLAAVLTRENERLLERQREMFAGPERLSEKWRIACDYLNEDLRSGYVRILWELWAVGLSDETLAESWQMAIEGWRSLLTNVASEWLDEHEIALPISPRALATLVANAFQGAETEILAGFGEDVAPHLEGLESIAGVIEWAERRSGDRTRRPRKT